MRKFFTMVVMALATILVIPSCTPIQAAQKARGVAVLMYHDFGTHSQGITITEAQLDAQLIRLKQDGFRFITPEEFEGYLEGTTEFYGKVAMVTIDDGYQSIYHIAKPVFERHKVPAMVFLITDSFDNPNPKHIPKLTRAHIKELQDTGLFYFAGHTHNSHYQIEGKAAITAYKAGESDMGYASRVAMDLTAMKYEVKSVGGNFKHFAYPYGEHNEFSTSVLLDLGISYHYTVVTGIANRFTEKTRIPRVDAGSYYITAEGLSSTVNGLLMK